MGSLAALLGSIAWPIVSRVLVAAGIGLISYAGVAVAVNVALDSVRSALGGITGDLADMLALAGMFEAMSIVAGGLIAGAAFSAVTKFGVRATG